MLYVLTNNAYPKGVVHSLVEKVTVELYDVWMILGFEKLDGFFLNKIS